MLKKLLVSILTIEARLALRKYNPKIVAVTGSVGKTSTKDAVHAVLASRFDAWKSPKSYNSDIGVPLAVLGCDNAWSNPLLWLRNLLKGLALIIFPQAYPEWLVLEVGADRPGDLEKLMRWLRPDIAVVTRFPEVPVHVEFYESIEALIAEESIPAFAVRDGGLVVLNGDDDKVLSLRSEVSVPSMIYGFLPKVSVRGEGERVAYKSPLSRQVPTGMRFSIAYERQKRSIELNGAIGMQHLYPILAAAAVGLSRGIPLADLPAVFAHHNTPPGRMKLIEGIRNTTIIDDSYNSSPVAARQALLALNGLKAGGPVLSPDTLPKIGDISPIFTRHIEQIRSGAGGRKIAVLGDMRELGGYSSDEHYRIGLLAGESVNTLVTVGMLSRRTAEGALDRGIAKGAVFQFDSSLQAGDFLLSFVTSGDTILIKGSESIRMERAVEAVMAHPEEKERLLVRQEPEWQRR